MRHLFVVGSLDKHLQDENRAVLGRIQAGPRPGRVGPPACPMSLADTVACCRVALKAKDAKFGLLASEIKKKSRSGNEDENVEEVCWEGLANILEC